MVITMDTILSIISFIILGVYVYAGNKANNYLKYYLLNQRVEVYSDTGQHIVNKLVYAFFLGCFTIPVALIHYYFFNRSSE